VCTLIVCVLLYLLAEDTIIKVINFVFYGLTNSSNLLVYINQWVPDNFSVHDALTENVFFPAWNIET